MPSINTPAFQRRQEEQRQQQRQQAADIRAESVRRARGGTTAPSPAYIAAADAAYEQVQHHRNLPATSILDQMRPLQEQQHIRQWGEARSNALMFGADLDTDAARIFHNPAYYNAGVDPISRRDSESGRGGFTLLTGSRGYEELDRAIQERITQERARPTPSYDMESTVARYGHLLTAADRQRMGYVAPEVTYEDYRRVSAAFTQEDADRYSQPRTDGNEMHYFSEPSLLTFGPASRGLQSKGPKPVANFLAPTPGPTDQELAAADEWLRTSPWG